MSTSLEEPQNSEIDLPALRVEMGLDNSEFFQTRISRTKKLEIFIDENLGEITEVTQKLWDELDGSEFGLFFSYMQHSGTETSIGDLFEKLHEIFEHLEVETRDRLMYLLSGESVSDITKNLKGDGTSSEKYAFGIAMVIVANMSHLITELGSQIMYFRENGCEDITDKVELVQSLCRRYAALINQFDYISLGQRKLIEVHGITLPTYNEWFLDLKQDLEKVLNLNQSIDISTVNDVNTDFILPEQLCQTIPARFDQEDHIAREVEALGDILDRYLSGNYAIPFLLTNTDYLSAMGHFLEEHQDRLVDPSSTTSIALDQWLSDIETSEKLDKSLFYWVQDQLAKLREVEDETKTIDLSGQIAEYLEISDSLQQAFVREKKETIDRLQRAAGAIHKFAHTIDKLGFNKEGSEKRISNKIFEIVLRVHNQRTTVETLEALPEKERELYENFLIMAGHFIDSEESGRLMFYLDSDTVRNAIPVPFAEYEDTCERFIAMMRESIMAYIFTNKLNVFYLEHKELITQLGPQTENPMLSSSQAANKRHLFTSLQKFFRTYWTNYEVLDAINPEGFSKKGTPHPLQLFCGKLMSKILTAFGDELSVAMRKIMPPEEIKSIVAYSCVSTVPEAEEIFEFHPSGEFKGYQLRSMATFREPAELTMASPELLFVVGDDCKNPAIREWRVKSFMWFVWHTLSVDSPSMFCGLEKNESMSEMFADISEWIKGLEPEKRDMVCGILVQYYAKLKIIGKSRDPLDPLKTLLDEYKKKTHESSLEKELETPKISIAVKTERQKTSQEVQFIMTANTKFDDVALKIDGKGIEGYSTISPGTTTIDRVYAPGKHSVILTAGDITQKIEFSIKPPIPEISADFIKYLEGEEIGGEIIEIKFPSDFPFGKGTQLCITTEDQECDHFKIDSKGNCKIPKSSVRALQQNQKLEFMLMTPDGLKSETAKLDISLQKPRIDEESLKSELATKGMAEIKLGENPPRGADLWVRMIQWEGKKGGKIIKKTDFIPIEGRTLSTGKMHVHGTKVEVILAYGWGAVSPETAATSIMAPFRKEKQKKESLPVPKIAEESKSLEGDSNDVKILGENDFPLKVYLADMPKPGKGEHIKYQWKGESSLPLENDFVVIEKPNSEGLQTLELRYTSNKRIVQDQWRSIKFEYKLPRAEVIEDEAVSNEVDSSSIAPEDVVIPIESDLVENWELALIEPEKIIAASEYTGGDMIIRLPGNLVEELEISGETEIRYSKFLLSQSPEVSMIRPKSHASLHNFLLPIVAEISKNNVRFQTKDLVERLPRFETRSDRNEIDQYIQNGKFRFRTQPVTCAKLVTQLEPLIKEFPETAHLFLTKGEYSGIESAQMDFQIETQVITLKGVFSNDQVEWQCGVNNLIRPDSINRSEDVQGLQQRGKNINNTTSGNEWAEIPDGWEGLFEPFKAYLLSLLTQAAQEISQQKALEEEEKRANRKMNRSQNNSKERISLDVQAMDRFNREEGLIVKKGSFVPELTNYKYPTLRSLPKEERQSSRVILRDLKIVVGVGQYDEEEYRVFEQIPIYQENFEKRCRSHIGFNGGKNGFSNERASALCWDVFDEKFGNDLTNVAGDIRSKYNGEKMLPTDDVELQALILSVLHHPSGEENDWSISECKKLKEAVFDLIDPKLGNISTAVIERFKENKMPIDCQFYLFETVQQFIDKKPKTMQAKKDQKKKKLKE